MNISISKEDMIALLEKSFEEGYNGYLDMKNDSVNLIFEEYINKLKSPPKGLSEGWANISLPNSLNYNYGLDPYNSVWITNSLLESSNTSVSDTNNSSNITLTTNS
jgi:hypothetical protein